MASRENNTYNDLHEQLFIELFKEYEERLYIFIVRILKSDDTAKDILQDVFLKLWSIRGRLNDIENINAFLYKLTENRVYDHLRKIAGEKKMKNALWSGLREHTQDHSHTLVSKEYDSIIEKAIEQLPAQRKKIYLLSKRAGLKQSQIADYLNISHHTVRNHLSEAFKQIGAYLKQNLPFFFL